eukprot:jgi/Tetstr1/443504/TSEL_031508.t1
MAEGATDSIACSTPDASLVPPSNAAFNSRGRKPQKPRPKKGTLPKIRPRVIARTSPRLILAEAEPASPDGTTRPMVCGKSNCCIAKLLRRGELSTGHDPPSPPPPTSPSTPACPPSGNGLDFATAVALTRRAIHGNGQKASLEELAKRVHRCFKPSEFKSCTVTTGYEYASTNAEGGGNRPAQKWIRAEVDGLVNPGCSRNAPPVYHVASRTATRAWLTDYFDPKHGRTEKIPNPSSDREEWHLLAWANKAKVYRTYMDDDTYCPSVSIAKKKRDKHWERVTTERFHVEAAILEWHALS